ncbi:UNVERIFIED_CONTAM: transformer 2 beta [Siphonaria sp. JEL0065]|nr:transformer 2 beta [Siphonaria sp. JEL0065]
MDGYYPPPLHYARQEDYYPPPARDPRDYDDRRVDYDRRDPYRREDYRRDDYRRDDYHQDDYRKDDYRRRRSRSRSPPPRRSYDDRRDRGDRYRFRDSRPPRRFMSPSARGTPEPCNVLGVFGLSILTRERDLEKLFGEFGRVQDIAILYDKHTNKSRGFGFITYEDVDAATKAREAMNGYEFNERRMRVDYSLTKRGHESTPGQYMGRPDQAHDGGRREGGGGRGDDEYVGRSNGDSGDVGASRVAPLQSQLGHRMGEVISVSDAAGVGGGAGYGNERRRSSRSRSRSPLPPRD